MIHSFDRMAPMVDLQKKVYLSILKKELPKLLALSSGASSTQSLQNIVRVNPPIFSRWKLLFTLQTVLNTEMLYFLWSWMFCCSDYY